MPVLADFNIPAEIIAPLVFVLVSFFSWLKNQTTKTEEKSNFEEFEPYEELREAINHNQWGEGIPRDIYEQEASQGPPPIPTAEEIQEMAQRVQPVLEIENTPAALSSVSQPLPLESKTTGTTIELNRMIRRSSHRRRLDRMLRTPYAAKEAILLTEILGPPKGLQE